jgi:hypothetical protein
MGQIGAGHAEGALILYAKKVATADLSGAFAAHGLAKIVEDDDFLCLRRLVGLILGPSHDDVLPIRSVPNESNRTRARR